jgi:hypothetical protein
LKTSIDCVSEDSDRFPKVVLPATSARRSLRDERVRAGRVTGATIRSGETLDRTALREAMGALLGSRRARSGRRPLSRRCVRTRSATEPSRNTEACSCRRLYQRRSGAGDAFTAGVLLGWHDGRPVEEALRYGVCAAAANLADETCTGGIKPLEACLALGEQFGFRSSG